MVQELIMLVMYVIGDIIIFYIISPLYIIYILFNMVIFCNFKCNNEKEFKEVKMNYIIPQNELGELIFYSLGNRN